MRESKVNVLVVGAGPTGLTLACELMRRGISCRILEKQKSPTVTSRAMGVHRRTLEILGAIGVPEPVRADVAVEQSSDRSIGAMPLLGVAYVGDKIRLRWPGNAERSKNPFAGRFVPQSDLERVLRQRLEALGGQVEFGAEVTEVRQDDVEVVAVAGSHEFTADWLVGCDGAHSRIRSELGLPFYGTTHDYDLLLADVDITWDATPVPQWATMSGAPVIAFTCRDGWMLMRHIPEMSFWRMMGSVRSPGRDAPVTTTTLRLMQDWLRYRASDPNGKITRVMWMSSWRGSERIVPTYRHGRIFVAGDAAHVHSPVGSQGLNTGVQDAYNLAWKLAMVVRARAPSSLLDTYEIERLPVGRSVLRWTRLMSQIVESEWLVSRIVRDEIVLRLFRIPALRAWFMLKLSQLQLNYRRSPLSDSSGRFSRQAPKAGDRAPDAVLLKYPSQATTTILEEIRGIAWHALLFQGDTCTDKLNLTTLCESAMRIEALSGAEVKAHLVVSDASGGLETGWLGAILLDGDGKGHSAYAATAPCLYLVRPDGYIAFRSQPPFEGRLMAYLRRVFDLERIAAHRSNADR